MADLTSELAPHLLEQSGPEGDSFRSVRWAGVEALAGAHGLGLAEAMARCLDDGLWPERLRPNRGAFSAADQARLLRSRACLIGLGGLGGLAALLLGRLGVGALTLVDGDVFDESNLNRQMLSSPRRIGRPKAQCAAEELAALCPYVSLRAEQAWAEADNLPGLLAGAEVVVDCLDNLPARYTAEQAAHAAGLAFVHGAVAGLEGFIMVSRPGGPGLAALYGPEPVPKAQGAELRLGVPTMTPAQVAGLQVNEAVKLLLGRPALEPGLVLHLDLSLPAIEELRLA